MAEQPDILLDALCSSALRLLHTAPGPVIRLRISSGAATVEVEWRDTQHDAPAPTALAEPEPPTNGEVLAAPMVGTFYRSPAPDQPPFVREGDRVEPGQQVGILEAMKLMNPIEADRAGQVAAILVADASPVEYGQPLLVITPDGA